MDLRRRNKQHVMETMDGKTSATFGHVIHPVDVKVAMRAGELMRNGQLSTLD